VTRSRLSPLVIVFLTVFIDLIGFGIVIPLLPLYAKAHNPTPVELGLLMASFSAMQFVFAPLLGRLSDRVGRRPVVLISLAGTVVSYLLFAFAQTLGGLFASRLLAGVTGANIAAAQAIIADVTPPEERARGMGLIGMAFGLGFIFGPALGGFAVRFGEAGPGLFAAALSSAAFLWALAELPETRPAGGAPAARSALPFQGLARTFAKPGLAPFLVLAVVATTAFSGFEATFALFLSSQFGASPAHVAWAFVGVGIAATIVQGGLIRPLVARLGELRVITLGAACLLAGFVILLGTETISALVVALAFLSLGWGVTIPSLSGLISRRTAAAEQGEVLGTFQSMTAVGRIVGPFWGAGSFLRFGPQGPFGSGIVLEGVALILAGSRLVLEKRKASTP
jgi:DHA1 family tetracycline resistance protein-like MFS transporter